MAAPFKIHDLARLAGRTVFFGANILISLFGLPATLLAKMIMLGSSVPA
jgi:hypothetical protein